jgi:hypothetical protein
MAERKADQPAETEAPPEPTTGAREQLGGTILEEGRVVGYTEEGALSAVPGGPVDPTILPGTGTVDEPPQPPETGSGSTGTPGAGATEGR